MKNLNQHLNDYLKLRRQLGYKLQEAEFLLRNFVRFVEQEGTGVITAKWLFGGLRGRTINRRRAAVA